VVEKTVSGKNLQASAQRTGSHILARNICIAAWMITPVFPIEALTQNPGILIQKLF